MADEIQPGTILVTFDAGGMGSGIDPNPQFFVQEDENTFGAVWTLHRCLNAGAGFTAEIGNIVPCHDQDIQQALLGYTFVSEKIPSQGPATGWRWKFTRTDPGDPSIPPPQKLLGEIKYEIFFSYGPELQKHFHPSQRRVLSLRQSIGVDPSLILPPKQSGPGLSTDKD